MNPNTICIPVPKGWIVADNELRCPKKGEYFYNLTIGEVQHREEEWADEDLQFIIVKPEWTPPASCPKGVTFKKACYSEVWYIVQDYSLDEVLIPVNQIYSDFTPPPYSPYTVE